MTTRRQEWTGTLGWTAAFSLVMVIITSWFIAEPFAYLGYVPREFVGGDLLISGLAALILAFTLPRRWRYPSHFAYAFLVATVGFPVIFIPVFWGPLSAVRLTLMQTVIVASFCLARLAMTGERRRIQVPIVDPRLYWAVVTALAVMTVIYLFVSTGISPSFLTLSDVYEQRSEYNGRAASVGQYAVGWLSGGVMPAVLAAGLYHRSRPLIVAEAMRDEPAMRFLVLGEGLLLPEYRKRYSYLPNLTFAPKVPKQAVQSVLTTCDLLYLSVHKSQVWEYGQSLNKLIDYMLSGKPIVASYTGFPTMINEAHCGTYVPAGDVPALAQEFRRYASMDPAERSEMGERGRTWILEHRNCKRLAHDYLPILLPSQRPIVE